MTGDNRRALFRSTAGCCLARGCEDDRLQWSGSLLLLKSGRLESPQKSQHDTENLAHPVFAYVSLDRDSGLRPGVYRLEATSTWVCCGIPMTAILLVRRAEGRGHCSEFRLQAA